jgi:hypothetical protein
MLTGLNEMKNKWLRQKILYTMSLLD